MLNKDFTTKILGIKEAIVTDFLEDDNKVEITIEISRKPHKCPDCGYVTSLVHDYRYQLIKDIPLRGKYLYLRYRKRRYKCGMCKKRFNENQTIVPKHHQLSSRLSYYLINQMKEKRSLTDIARANNISVTTMMRLLEMVNYGNARGLPQVLSIDEFKGNTDGRKFQCILTDPQHSKIVDILKGRESYTIIDYIKQFENRNNVEYFVMDMNKGYLEIAKTFFPKAKIVIDRFHVVRYNTWAFDNIRRSVQSSLVPELRKYFKRSRRLLLTRMKYLNYEDKQAVNVMLGMSDKLTQGYLLKEKFYEFMDCNNSAAARIKLNEFMIHAYNLNLSEYKACTTMLNNWKPYILNSFDYKYSNGFTEGTNNKIKTIKRIAFGYRRFDNFRKRILLTSEKTG